MTSRLSHLTAVCITLVILAGTAGANDEIDFARKLADAGFHDLADDVGKEIAANPRAAAQDKQAVDLIRAEIKRSQAEREPNAAAKIRLLEESAGLFEDFVKKNEGHPCVPDARLSIAEVNDQIGCALVEIVKSPKSSEIERRDAIAKGEKAFESASTSLEAAVADFLKLQDEQKLIKARFLQPVTLYHKSLIYADADTKKRDSIEKALALIEKFEWDYDGFIVVYRLADHTGLCCTELARHYEAICRHDDAVREHDNAAAAHTKAADLLRKIEEEISAAPDLGLEMLREYRGIVLEACWNLINAQRAAGRFDKGAAAADGMLAVVERIAKLDPDWPARERNSHIQRALIAKGDCFLEMKMPDEAQRQFERAASFEGAWTAAAIERITRETGKSGSVPLQVACQAIDRMIAERNFQKAIALCSRTLSQIRTREQEKQLVPEILQRLGAAAFKSYDFLAAFVAYAAVTGSFPDCAEANSCALEAARSAGALYRLTRDPVDAASRMKMLSWLSERPGSAPIARFLLAEGKEMDGDLAGAIADYTKIPADSDIHEDAVFCTARCYYGLALKLGKTGGDEPDSAEVKKHLLLAREKSQEYLDAIARGTEGPSPSDRFAGNRKDYAFFANSMLAEICLHELVNEPAGALSIYGKMKADFGTDRARLAEIRLGLVNANIAAKDVSTAGDVLAELLRDSPTDLGVPAACRKVGRAFDNASKESTDAGKAEGLRAKAAGFYFLWIERSLDSPAQLAKIKPQDAHTIAAMLLKSAKTCADQGAELSGHAVSLLELLCKKEKFGKVDESVARAMGLEGMWQMNHELALGYAGIKEWEKAEAELAPVVESIGEKKAYLKEDYADILLELARKSGKSADPNWGRALAQLGWLQRNLTEDTERWWRACYKHTSALVEKGDYEPAARAMTGFDVNYTNFDGGKWGFKAKFEALRATLKEKGFRLK